MNVNLNESQSRAGSRRFGARHEAEAMGPLGSDSGNAVDDGFLHSEGRGNAFDVEDGVEPVPRTSTPDFNVYQQKKTLAQGMMDLALLSANANQLRYVLEAGNNHPYYYPNLILISISLIMQIGVGIGLILNSRYNVKKREDLCKANSFNNFTVIGIFAVTIVNVFISAFGIGGSVAE